MAHHLEHKCLRPGPRLKDSRRSRQPRRRHGRFPACGREGQHQRSLRATELDREYARIAGVSLEDYMAGKRRMAEEKKAGLHGGG